MIIRENLSTLADDKRVLKNPHKGWYWHYFDNGMTRPLYRDRIPEGEDYTRFPGLNHLYLRIDWGDIQPDGPDRFDWSAVDAVMERWGALGYSFSFRVCCQEPNTGMRFATPEWLFRMGCRGAFYPPLPEECPEWYLYPKKIGMVVDPNDPQTEFHTSWEPDYGDELFLKYFELFLIGFARKFDGDPRVEFIDVGSYGNWGEGHVYRTSKRSAGVGVLKKHIYLHRKHFRKTFVLINDDLIGTLNHCTPEEKQDLFETALMLNTGIRDDSIVAGSYKRWRYHSLRTPELFDAMYPNAPVDIELGHYGRYPKEDGRDGLVVIECARRAHATFAGFHTYPEDWLKDNYYVTEYLANRLGYWYIINSVTHNDVIFREADSVFGFELENMGFAPSYHRFAFELKLTHRDSGAEFLFSDPDFDIRTVGAGEKADIRMLARLDAGAPSGTYSVRVRLREGTRAILLALKEESEDADGFYLLSQVNVRDI